MNYRSLFYRYWWKHYLFVLSPLFFAHWDRRRRKMNYTMHHLFPEGTLTREHEEKVPAMKWNDIPSPLLSLLNFMAWNTQSKNTSTHFRKYLTVGREEKFNQSEVSTHFSFWEDFYPHNESKPAALYITAVKKCVFLSKKLLPMTFNFIKKKKDQFASQGC